MDAKKEPSGPPSSFSIVSTASSVGNWTTESWSTASSSKAAAGSTSGRTLKVCASLMNVGPSFSQMTRASLASDAPFSSSASTPFCTSSVATRRRKGTLSRRNSPQRSWSADPCDRQYVSMRSLSYESGSPVSSSTLPSLRSAT